MKNCPKCQQSHTKPGVFCSRTCANSRVFSEQALVKKSEAQRLAMSRKTPEQRQAMIEAAKVVTVAKAKAKRQSTSTEQLGHEGRRRKLIEEQDGTCLGCKNTKWMGQPIVLELDHIDGNTQNNVRDNLRMLCPNCHSQTPTWRGKNRTSL